MNSNRGREMYKHIRNYQLWELSQKYTQILVNQIKETNDLTMISGNIWKQFLSEMTSRGFSKNHTVVQCWDTMIRTILKHPEKRNLHKQSIQLLHQTSVQRSYQQ